MLVYAATIFLSAFLLFQVQPLIAKFIPPWFGGSAAVWSAASLFFQPYYTGTTWAILSPSEKFFESKNFVGDGNSVVSPLLPKPGFPAWTDDFSDIVTIIK